MTALCPGGGPSAVKAGFASTIVYGGGAIGDILTNARRTWLAGLGALLGVVSVETPSFCMADPPAEPTFTPADATAILQLNDLDAFNTAIGKVRDAFLRALWFQLCECTGGGTPAIAEHPQPINWPDTSRVYAPGSSAPCQVIDSGQFAMAGTNPTSRHWVTDLSTINGYHVVPVPGGATHVRVRGQSIIGTTATNAMRMDYAVGNAGMTAFGTPNVSVLMHPTASFPTSVANFDSGAIALVAPSNNLTVNAYCSPGSSGVDYTAQVTIEFFCGGAPGTGLSPCGPDPVTLGLLQQIASLVTLIQRQAVPFAYIAGTAHAGLTGNGQISVQGLIGCVVDVTALGTTVGQVGGDPDVLYRAGWINWLSADGATAREFLSSEHFVSLPAAAGAFTAIGYSLPPGVTVTITELEREAS